MDGFVADWYYIGHYGQLGPLTREQIDELIEGGVISRDTYVWRNGMTDWVPAERAQELRANFDKADPFLAPPPPPGSKPVAAPPVPANMASWRSEALAAPSHHYPAFGTVRSDRSRVLAGVLNLFLPGVGRIYLGYAAHGVLQLVLSLCMVGFIWSFVDGIIILAGGVKYDGYGRVLSD